jgi:hypothetical protein
MESSRSIALEALKGVVTRLEQVVPGTDLNTPMTLNAITPYEQTLKTSFGREVSPLIPTANDSDRRGSYGLQACMRFTIGAWFELWQEN